MDDGEVTGYMSWDPERQVRYDEARQRVEQAIGDMARIAREDDFPDDPPYVQGWVAVAEWTNVDMERRNAGGMEQFTPHGQMISVTVGLTEWARNNTLG